MAPPHTNESRRDRPINLIPRLLRNLYCWYQRQFWTDKGILLGSMNTHFRRQWESAANLFARMTIASLCWIRARRPTSRASDLRKMGAPEVSTYPAMARFKFGGGRFGGVRYAADIKTVIAGRRGAFTSFALGADIPGLLRGGAIEALGGQLDFARDISTVRNHGVDIPLKSNELGHFALSVVAFRGGPPCADRGPKLAA